MLGEGAMGRVWLARNLTLDLPLAIKIVQPDLHGREAMSRLLTEARVEARLLHPNIVRVFDCQNDGDAAYAVMELLEGCTLADVMAQGPLPAALAVRLMLPLLSGLSAAHRAGIVHRDVKPENIYIARVGDRICPKLLDFGIARLGQPGLAKPNPARVRRSGRRMVMGSPGYMSPEQAWGDPDVDERTDLWSAAVVLYEAISGKDAFPAASYADYLKALSERELPPLIGPGTAQLWPILSRALVKSRAHRLGSTELFTNQLRTWLATHGGEDDDLTSDSLPVRWLPPGGLVARALARTADQTLASDPSSLQRAASQHSHVDELVTEDVVVIDHSEVRTISTRRRSSFDRMWMVTSIAAGALLGMSVALAHGNGAGAVVHAEARPARVQQQQRAPAKIERPRARIAEAHPVRTAVRGRIDLPQPTAAAPAARPVRAVETPPVHKPQRSPAQHAQREQQLRREATALGLKSPW
jgi:serine/threonine protein kinase